MAHYRKSGYQCPLCNIHFNVESTVIKHMGQPWSDCATSWMCNLEDISSNLSDHNALIPSQLVPNLYAQDVPMDDAPIANQEEPDCLDNGSNVQGDTTSQYILTIISLAFSITLLKDVSHTVILTNSALDQVTSLKVVDSSVPLSWMNVCRRVKLQ